MDNELKDAVLLGLLRHRLNRAPAERAAARGRVRGLVARFFDTPDGFLDAYNEAASDDPQAARARAQAYADGLNAQRVGHVVQPCLVPPGGDRGPGHPHGEREASTGRSPDVRDVADEQRGQAPISRWARCDREECCVWDNSLRCLDRQRAGTCPALSGRDRGPVESRDAVTCGAGGSTGGAGEGGGGVVTVACGSAKHNLAVWPQEGE